MSTSTCSEKQAEVHLIPNDPDEITPDWFLKILNITVNPSTWKTVHNIHEGTGFLSLMSRIQFEDTNGKKHYFIVKLLPSVNSSIDGARDIMLGSKYDMIEILTYKELLPKLCEEFPDLHKYLCKTYYAEIQEEDLSIGRPYNSVIVMEDLNALGYTTVNFADSIGEKDFLQGLDFLANFHVSSLCLEKKSNSSLSKLHPWSVSFYNPDTYEGTDLPGLYSFFPGSFPVIYEFLERNSKSYLIPLFKKLEVSINDCFKCILREGQKNPVMIHGDLWPHNMLYHPDKVLKAIDWQLLGITDQTYDVCAYITSTLNHDNLNAESIKKALKYYYDKYEQLCNDHGIKPTRNWKEFEKYALTYGLGYAMIWGAIGGAECLVNLKVCGNDKLLKMYELYETLKTPEFMLSLIS